MVQKSLIAIKILCPSLNFLAIMVPSIILLCVSLLSWNMRTKEDLERTTPIKDCPTKIETKHNLSKVITLNSNINIISHPLYHTYLYIKS
jgi:hypothetical protein